MASMTRFRTPAHFTSAPGAALAIALVLALALAGCNSTGQTARSAVPASAPPAPAPSSYANVPAGVTPSNFRMPAGTGCKGDVARWAAIQENDLRSGHVSKSVYTTIQGEIAQARAACDAGREAEAAAMVRASRSRHGYPAG